MFFEVTKLSPNKSSLTYSSSNYIKTRLFDSCWCNLHYTAKSAKQTQALLAGANIGVINIQSLVLPRLRGTERSTNSLKRRLQSRPGLNVAFYMFQFESTPNRVVFS